MSEDVQTKPVKSSPVMQRFTLYHLCRRGTNHLPAGCIPMWLKARAATSRLGEREHQLMLVRMQSNLASAAIDARRGDYEPARRGASEFFTSLRAEIDKGDTSNFTQAQRQAMEPLFAGRDEIITLLARSDPASADRLSDVCVIS